MHGGNHPDPSKGRGPNGGDAGGHERRDQNRGGCNHRSGARFASSGDLRSADSTVESGGPTKPGNQSGRLDRVPSPIPAPAQLHIGPNGAGDQPDREQGHRNQQQRLVESHFLAGQGRGGSDDGGQQEPDQACIQDRRVPDHGWILEHRLKAEAIDGGDCQLIEWRGHDRHQQAVTANKSGADQHRPSPLLCACLARRRDGDPGQHRGPQQERAFGPRPGTGDADQGSKSRSGVVGDVDERPVLNGECPQEQGHRRGEGQSRDRQ